VGPSEDLMLVSVVALSRPADQLVENNEGPKGFDDPNRLARWGIEPARRRDRIAGLLPALEVTVLGVESTPETPGGRKGLVDGVGRDVLDR
jgi:hypothetical protein